MLTNQNIVYFGPEKWEGMWRNRHHLMSRFARANKVLYVEPWLYLKKLRADVSNARTRKEVWEAVRTPRITRAGENLYIYHSPVTAPISTRFPMSLITRELWIARLRSMMGKLGFSNPITWYARPAMVDLVGRFNEKLKIYHVVDEYLGYGSDSDSDRRERSQAREKAMIRKADLVFVVSQRLLQSKGDANGKTHLVENGVDFSAYSTALNEPGDAPKDIVSLPRPIIGYSGLISARLDLDLIHQIATGRPQWSIVLMGAVNPKKISQDIERLKRLNNVHFLGLKDITEVPYYIKHFDVCFIPYGINEQTQFLSSLKLFDFMAAGKPIVTTDFPAARPYREVIQIAESADRFIPLLDEALRESDGRRGEISRRIASENSWESRVEEVSAMIATRFSHA